MNGSMWKGDVNRWKVGNLDYSMSGRRISERDVPWTSTPPIWSNEIAHRFATHAEAVTDAFARSEAQAAAAALDMPC